ncbi:dehydrogenase/reductase SDR family member 11-like isoform X2 [Ambystoma mexicanum]|uniref:dehydrogenase/reductase SDR family member 11-like isoform X2 n=1 Tax=Ambystoma mexicanum TaxID=8296 RepID=UPI0037E97A40
MFHSFLSSLLGHIFQTASRSHFYCSTKHAVTALTEGVRQELREAKSHIRVTCLEVVDIANAVVHVLGTPPKVQAGGSKVETIGVLKVRATI